ncbi:metallophosphoesterase family protein [Paenibacillus rigui]|uniref:Metallophosphoesterase n=1 Tax=Paenibacillus rigui TaxID=554312 RepID=A0A229UV71_9BACL|nr:metallophosphoesterase family protein [Paenibacillus rigui]OXM87270.1 metallophosphoesterase [Paenibacillus rigui]
MKTNQFRDPNRLTFREDGTFTIVQLTDLHWKQGDAIDRRTEQLIGLVLEEEQPDFVFFTGDTIESGTIADPRQAYLDAVAPVDRRGIPWAAVFGNHDAEGSVTKAELMEAQLSCGMCRSQAGPEELSGIGNYTLPVYGRDGALSAVLYALDSGEYAKPLLHGYDWIRRDQIDWYVRQSEAYAGMSDGRPLPGLAFFHIPLPEYVEVWAHETCFGEKDEGVASPKVNSGMFAAMLEQGNIDGVFVGHDHVNDYWGELHGIRLCYGRATGYNTYGRDGWPRGARIIRLTEGNRGFQTWLRLADGTRVDAQPEHKPEVSREK